MTTQQADELLPDIYIWPTGMYDAIWKYIADNDALSPVRTKLSIHQIRMMIDAILYASQPFIANRADRTPPHAEAVRVLVEATRPFVNFYNTQPYETPLLVETHEKLNAALNHPAVAAVIRNEAVTDCDAQKRNTVMKEGE